MGASNGKGMVEEIKNNWLSLIVAAILGVGGGISSYAFITPQSLDAESRRLADSIKLWTIDYVDTKTPSENVVERLDSIDKRIEKLSILLEKRTDKLHELSIAVNLIKNQLKTKDQN